MAKSTRSTAKKVVAKGKATASATAVRKTSSTVKKVVAKAAPTAKKVAKPAKALKPAAGAAKPVAKAAGKPKAVVEAAAKRTPPAAPVSKAKPAAAPVSAKVKHTSNMISSAAPATVDSAPAAKAAPLTTPATAPVATPAPTSKPTKQVITEENKKSSRKGVITPNASEAGITMEGGRYALAATTNIDLPAGYRPSSDEEYMSPMHLRSFATSYATGAISLSRNPSRRSTTCAKKSVTSVTRPSVQPERRRIRWSCVRVIAIANSSRRSTRRSSALKKAVTATVRRPTRTSAWNVWRRAPSRRYASTHRSAGNTASARWATEAAMQLLSPAPRACLVCRRKPCVGDPVRRSVRGCRSSAVLDRLQHSCQSV